MYTINADCSGISAPPDAIKSDFKQLKEYYRTLFIPVYGYREAGIYTVERDGNLSTILGYIQTIARPCSIFVIAIPANISAYGAAYLATLQKTMWQRGINIYYQYLHYGTDPRDTRAMPIGDMCNFAALLRFYDHIAIAPQQAAIGFHKNHFINRNCQLSYLAYAIAGRECTIASYRAAMAYDRFLYDNMPTLVGTLDQLSIYPAAIRMTRGYKSLDLLVQGLADMSPMRNDCKVPFILMPWKPSHEPYKVHIINDILYEMLQAGYEVYSCYDLQRSDGTRLHNWKYLGRDAYLKLLRYGKKCVVPLLEPLHHCLHYTIYELLANDNQLITVANEEIPDHADIIGNEYDLEEALARAINKGYETR